MEYKGVYTTQKKDGTPSYRVSVTYRGRHISLGSFPDKEKAALVYLDAERIKGNPSVSVQDFDNTWNIPHSKFISLVNFRDNGIYIATPIYLRQRYFEYYLSEVEVLKFDRDDLFFYSSHKIQRKSGYLFVSDYGSQYSILSRYGIRPYAVCGRDYIMVNGDALDYRYDNLKIINKYTGVTASEEGARKIYTAAIHINGSYIIGRYDSEETAAAAYNKAADILNSHGVAKKYIKNYIVSLSRDEYKSLYDSIDISNRIISYRR